MEILYLIFLGVVYSESWNLLLHGMSENFGNEIRLKDFMLEAGKVFVNHGSFGSVPQCVFDRRLRLLEQQERQPDLWFRGTYKNLWWNSIEVVGLFLRANPNNLVFIHNTTTGSNAVIRSLKLKSGDAVIINMFTYGSLKNICQQLADDIGFKVITVEFPYPLTSADQIVDAYDRALRTHNNAKLVIADHISSKPPMLFPVKQLVDLCRRHNKPIYIDGAHTPGHVDLDLEALGADFYSGDLHKWSFAIRGCAVLYVHPRHHKLIYPPITSRYNNDDWQYNFQYQGTDDNSPYYAAADAIRYFQEIGDHKTISTYNTQLANQAVELLVTKWGTEHYPMPNDMRTPYMRIVRLPDLGIYTLLPQQPRFAHSAVDLVQLREVMWNRFGIQSMFSVMDGIPWCRISAMVYNTIRDFEQLADAVLALKNESTEQTDAPYGAEANASKHC